MEHKNYKTTLQHVYRKFVSSKKLVSIVAILGVIGIGLVIFNSLYSSRSQAALSTGYGCNDYGYQTVNLNIFDINYNSECTRELAQADIANFNTALTTGGVSCTPSPAIVNTTITCSGNLIDNILPPGSGFTLRIGTATSTPCTFTGSAFSCAIRLGTAAGNFSILGSVDQTLYTEIGSSFIVNAVPVTPPPIVQNPIPIVQNLVRTGGINSPLLIGFLLIVAALIFYTIFTLSRRRRNAPSTKNTVQNTITKI
jgi:hypothetical protein